MRRLLVATICSLLAACGSAPQRSGAPSPAAQAPASPRSADTAPARPPATTASTRPGGYYKDDGPGDNPPPDLASIPDAQPRLEPLHRFANEPYVALGQSYTPSRELAPYRERGLASWYGRMFHGKPTSSGEPYDMYGMTAAHPTLPIPSYARVTNLRNGKSVIVRVNDRGPFHEGRVIDLSYAAATRLGYASVGSTQVEVESILPGPDTAQSASPPPVAVRPPTPASRGPNAVSAKPVATATAAVAGDAPAVAKVPDPASSRAEAADPIAALERAGDSPREHVAAELRPGAPSAAEDGGGIFLQLGAFRTSEAAQGLRERVRRELVWLAEALMIEAGNGVFRLHAGPYGSVDDARSIAARISASLGVKPLVVRRSF